MFECAALISVIFKAMFFHTFHPSLLFHLLSEVCEATRESVTSSLSFLLSFVSPRRSDISFLRSVPIVIRAIY